MTLFLSQLWSVLQDDRCKQYIYWNAQGDGFVIPSVADFENNVLPIYYKHNRYSSFLRSLSYYSFLKNSNNEFVEYTHPAFRKGHPESLTQIVRKPTTSSRHPATLPGPPRRSPAAAASYTPHRGPSQATPAGTRASSRPRKRSRAADGHEYDYGTGEFAEGVTLGDGDDDDLEAYDGYVPRKGRAYSEADEEGNFHSDGEGSGDEEEEEPEDSAIAAARARPRSESISGVANVLVAISGQTPTAASSHDAHAGHKRTREGHSAARSTEPDNVSEHLKHHEGSQRTRRPSIHVPSELADAAAALRVNIPLTRDAGAVQPSPLAEAIRGGALAGQFTNDMSNAMDAFSRSGPLNAFLSSLGAQHSDLSSPAAQFDNPLILGSLHGNLQHAAVMGAVVGMAAASRNNNGMPGLPFGSLTRSTSAESVSGLIAGAQGAGNAALIPQMSPSSNSLLVHTGAQQNGGDGEGLPPPPSAAEERQVSDWFRGASPTPTPGGAANPGGDNNTGVVYVPVPANIAQSVMKTFAAISALSPTPARSNQAGDGTTTTQREGGDIGFAPFSFTPRAPLLPLTSSFSDLESFKPAADSHPAASTSGAAAQPTA